MKSSNVKFKCQLTELVNLNFKKINSKVMKIQRPNPKIEKF